MKTEKQYLEEILKVTNDLLDLSKKHSALQVEHGNTQDSLIEALEMKQRLQTFSINLLESGDDTLRKTGLMIGSLIEGEAK